MKIIDTSSVNHVLAHGIRLRDVYYLAPDVREETEITEAIYGQSLSGNIKDISAHPLFNEATYIRSYREVLNRHSGRSFYNMTGFGDISILATIDMLRTVNDNPPITLFPEVDSIVTVITEDRALIKKIGQDFVPSDKFQVIVLGNTALN